MNLQTAKSYEDLLTGTVDPSPFDYAVMFKADGFFARQRAKKRFKLLKAIEPKLRAILRPQERVYWATTGTTVTLGEQFFVGWIAYYLNRRALVFSTERVLLIEIDGKPKAGRLVSQISYIAIASVKATWNGMCRIKLLNKTVYNFQSVPSADRKFLAEFLSGITQGTNAPFQRETGMEHLCPHCFVHVPAHPPACIACKGGFKSPVRAALLSFIFPGLGDWYIGHRGVALFEMFGAAFTWFIFVISPLIAPPNPAIPPPDAAYWTTVAIIILVAHGIDGVMTQHFALKGHHPHGPAPALSAMPAKV